MTDRFRERTIRVDRDVIENELRRLAVDRCVFIEGGGPPCPDEWPNDIESWCTPCTARRVLALAETEVTP